MHDRFSLQWLVAGFYTSIVLERFGVGPNQLSLIITLFIIIAPIYSVKVAFLRAKMGF